MWLNYPNEFPNVSPKPAFQSGKIECDALFNCSSSVRGRGEKGDGINVNWCRSGKTVMQRYVSLILKHIETALLCHSRRIQIRVFIFNALGLEACSWCALSELPVAMGKRQTTRECIAFEFSLIADGANVD